MSLKGIGKELRAWMEEMLACLPGSIGLRLRRCYWRKRFKQCGSNLCIGEHVAIICPERIAMGNNITISSYCLLSAGSDGNIELGDNVAIGRNSLVDASFSGFVKVGGNCLVSNNVTLRASSHNYERHDINICKQGHNKGVIVVGDDVWVGTRAVILPGTHVGDKAVIGAGAVVTRDIEEATVVGGVPARVIKHRIKE